jgi:hypothetical protein
MLFLGQEAQERASAAMPEHRCTVSEDMRMGRDARMSHVQDASAAAFGEYSTTIAAQEASEVPVPRPHCRLTGVRVI